MKFVNFEFEGRRGLGVLNREERGILAFSEVLAQDYSDMVSFLQKSTEEDLARLKAAVAEEIFCPAIPVCAARLLAPIERPVHDILCVGVNYKNHLEEAKENLKNFSSTSAPVFFSKRTNRIIGPEEKIQGQFALDEELDYEVELAVIIGKQGRDIAKEDAEHYIFGYSIFNDLSSRKLQNKHGQWFKGKSLDTYSAMGPVLLHKSALPFPVEAEVISRVNGEQRQRASTHDFLTGIPELIASLSAGMTLEPGDIIATGTPAGVGMGLRPPCFMQAGDIVECEIAPIGVLKNYVE